MQIVYVVCILAMFSSIVGGQHVINFEETATGNIQLTEDLAIPKINRGYTLWLPDGNKARGMLVFTHPRRDTIHSDALIDMALAEQLAVLYATTDNRLEFFFEKDRMQEIENYIDMVVEEYNINQESLLYCGMSLEGTRALKLAIFAKSGQSKHGIVPRAIVICDAPLDMIRFHREMIRAKELKFNEITTSEGRWVSAYLASNLEGTPVEAMKTYVEYSPYCHEAGGGSNLKALKNIPIRAYTEPDINWWIEHRGKDYYSMNAVDLAGLVNHLKLLGNDQAELITTRNKGYHPDGTRHPHSWSIVDEEEMIDWFVELLSE